VKDAQDELKRTEMNLLKPWSKELDDIIKGYAQKNGYDLVLDKSNPVIVYASGKINITSQIMDLFNKRYQEKSGKAKPKK
ncbi:MAG: OmpH family outer membrane protein, partial [Deltaproteobacteria bacterium]|nr:OmpH family outer membrane protein [Deltaproteobacteria bacterium]